MEPCIAAIATPPGNGGIAVIRVSGEKAIELCHSILRYKNPQKILIKLPGYSATYAEVWENDKMVDEVVALVFRAPHSYTGEDTVEISCHGGAVISQMVLENCLRAGAKMAAPGEFTRRAFMNGKLSLSQAEAVLGLIEASSRQEISGAAIVLQGEQNAVINQIKSRLITLAAHLSAWIDYTEEDVPEPEEQHFREEISKNRRLLEKMLEEYQHNQRIKRGIKVVIIGQPNVGKSTLFNLLVGRNRAITTPIAGTTRDVISEEIVLNGCPVLLCDTAGLRQSQDLIEAEGIRRSNLEIETADALIRVAEVAGVDLEDEIEGLQAYQKPALLILNKSDQGNLLEIPARSKIDILQVSATERPNETTKNIRDSLLRLLELNPLHPDAALLVSSRQEQEAKRAYELLYEIEQQPNGIIYDITGICLEEAIQALSSLIGENAADSIIDGVFSSFCVGK